MICTRYGYLNVFFIAFLSFLSNLQQIPSLCYFEFEETETSFVLVTSFASRKYMFGVSGRKCAKNRFLFWPQCICF